MRWIQRGQAPQKSKTNQPDVTGIPIQRKLPDQKNDALPANDVRVRYQPTPVSPIRTGGVIQCRGLGEILRSIFHRRGNRRLDGPCAVHALFCLGWEPGYTEESGANENRIQNARFGALGTRVEDNDGLASLQNRRVMVLFFYAGESIAFHVMYTDGRGYLRGVNNDPIMLMNMFNIRLEVEGQEVICDMTKMTFHHDDHRYIKYVTQDEYAAFCHLMRVPQPESEPDR